MPNVISAFQNSWRWLRTIRHFPVSALAHRLRLKILRKLYRAPSENTDLSRQWQQFLSQSSQTQHTSKLNPEKPLIGLNTFQQWQMTHDEALQQQMRERVHRLLEAGECQILNETFNLPSDPGQWPMELAIKSPLWRENFGYLEWLRPLLWHLTTTRENTPPVPELKALDCLQAHLEHFWELSPSSRMWSTYGVSRRILLYAEMLPFLSWYTDDFQRKFWRNFYQEAHYVATFPELDIRGNHVIKNWKALLRAALVFRKLPATQKTAERWLFMLMRELPAAFESQLLPDGFHFERTPMYHLWVLEDLLDCLHWLQADTISANIQVILDRLRAVATRMLRVATDMSHCSGQIPLFGDSSLPQTPDIPALLSYGRMVLDANPSEGSPLSPIHAHTRIRDFPDAGFACFHHQAPSASLILDYGDFGPRKLPAHSHCDIGSFELHVEDQAIIVDSGISEYEPSLIRDYFRGTAAHNTLWVPGEEQAEIWGSFRVAETPHIEESFFEQDLSGAKVTIAYENYNGRYRHQRSLYDVEGRFWVVQDWLQHQSPPALDRPCFSLLHIHPDCEICCEPGVFTIADRLLILPFGASKLEWSAQSPWRNNLNLYSPGFNLAKPGRMIALSPKPGDCFGWVMVPYAAESKPESVSLGEGADIAFSSTQTRYRLSWDSTGLHINKSAF